MYWRGGEWSNQTACGFTHQSLQATSVVLCHRHITFFGVASSCGGSLKCPRDEECVGQGKDVYFYKSGYHNRVNITAGTQQSNNLLLCKYTYRSNKTMNWCFFDITGSSHFGHIQLVLYADRGLVLWTVHQSRQGWRQWKVGRWLAWDSAILCQLSEAHQVMFPTILTYNMYWISCTSHCWHINYYTLQMWCSFCVTGLRGTPWWRCGDKFHRKDLYITLLMTLMKPGGIVPALEHKFD